MTETGVRPVSARTELDVLLELLGKRWMLHFFGERRRPHTIAAVYHWTDRADVVILWGEDTAIAYRMPITPDADVFAPHRVHWWYGGSAVWVLRAVLTLAVPGHPTAPDTLIEPPPSLRIPPEQRRPVHIRLPSYRP